MSLRKGIGFWTVLKWPLVTHLAVARGLKRGTRTMEGIGATASEAEQFVETHIPKSQAHHGKTHSLATPRQSRGTPAQHKPSKHVHRLMKVKLDASQQLVTVR